MIFSKYNITSGIRDSENYFIVNLLSGNADILTPEDEEKMRAAREGKDIINNEFKNDLIDKGYLINQAEESKEYRRKYLDSSIPAIKMKSRFSSLQTTAVILPAIIAIRISMIILQIS